MKRALASSAKPNAHVVNPYHSGKDFWHTGGWLLGLFDFSTFWHFDSCNTTPKFCQNHKKL